MNFFIIHPPLFINSYSFYFMFIIYQDALVCQVYVSLLENRYLLNPLLTPSTVKPIIAKINFKTTVKHLNRLLS
jgi:hypothetical protein